GRAVRNTTMFPLESRARITPLTRVSLDRRPAPRRRRQGRTRKLPGTTSLSTKPGATRGAPGRCLLVGAVPGMRVRDRAGYAVTGSGERPRLSAEATARAKARTPTPRAAVSAGASPGEGTLAAY